jgi:hypothetical protein
MLLRPSKEIRAPDADAQEVAGTAGSSTQRGHFEISPFAGALLSAIALLLWCVRVGAKISSAR